MASFVIVVHLLLQTLLWITPSSSTPSANQPAPVQGHTVVATRSVYMPEKVSFAGEAMPLNEPEVRERLERELTLNTYRQSPMLLILKRQGRWHDFITKILKEEGVPEDFFYLAVAESDLDIYATSPVGAHSFWQFMKATALEYDLEVNDGIDQRRDVEKATRAACRYLKDAYKKFGNWTMVAASYNRGMNGLRKAADAQQTNNYYDLYLNTETYRYIFRIAALKIIMENPTQYNFSIDDSERYQPLKVGKTIEVTENIASLPEFAKANGTTYKMLKVYNPWLDDLQGYALTVKKGKSYTLLLP